MLQLVAELPVDEWGRLEEGFDIESHLAGRLFHMPLEDGSSGSHWTLRASGASPKRFWKRRGCSNSTGPMRAACSSWRRLWKAAARLDRRAGDTRSRSPAPGACRDAGAGAARHAAGELRPYQRTGYGWLRALSESGFGGVLADDMGLGKTVQTLALLAHRHLEEETSLPSLLVVPTSLVGNWRREAARFVPDLKVLVLHGPTGGGASRKSPTITWLSRPIRCSTGTMNCCSGTTMTSRCWTRRRR